MNFPMFQKEASALARIIALAYDPTRKPTDEPPEDVVRLLAEALQSAREQGALEAHQLWQSGALPAKAL